MSDEASRTADPDREAVAGQHDNGLGPNGNGKLDDFLTKAMRGFESAAVILTKRECFSSMKPHPYWADEGDGAPLDPVEEYIPAFLYAYADIGPGHKVLCQDLHSAWRKFCWMIVPELMATNRHPTRRRFKHYLNFWYEFTHPPIKTNGGRLYYPGIRLIGTPPAPSEWHVWAAVSKVFPGCLPEPPRPDGG